VKAIQPITKIEMIERSLRCFVCGLLGLLPVIGIPIAVHALVQHMRVKRGQGAMWNPAYRYCFWGALCAEMGLALFVLVPIVVITIGIISGLL
jgi:hypothetical protein